MCAICATRRRDWPGIGGIVSASSKLCRKVELLPESGGDCRGAKSPRNYMYFNELISMSRYRPEDLATEASWYGKKSLK